MNNVTIELKYVVEHKCLNILLTNSYILENQLYCVD